MIIIALLFKRRNIINLNLIKKCCVITRNLNKMESQKQNLVKIFLNAVEAVKPSVLIKQNVKLDKHMLKVCNKEFKINRNCYVVGFGKAVYAMSTELELILGHHLIWGIVSVPIGMLKRQCKCPNSRIMYMEGAANNLPDKASYRAAKEIKELVKTLKKDDLLIVLISGGGSALLPAPLPPITLKDKSRLVEVLANRGANILELNCVRKRLSKLKGGGLAVLAYPAQVVTLILSDVIGDPLHVIASGPTVPNTDSPQLAINIIQKYCPDYLIPTTIKIFMRFQSETPPMNFYPTNTNRSTNTRNKSQPQVIEGNYQNVSNNLIGNNSLAIKCAAAQALKLGYETAIMSVTVSGDVTLISRHYAKIAFEIYKIIDSESSKDVLASYLHECQEDLNVSDEAIKYMFESFDFDSPNPKCLLFGGETTVQVVGTGKGGRNQQLALEFAYIVDDTLLDYNCKLYDMSIALLSCGTDGIDGPTNAAGAIGFNGMCHIAKENNLNPRDFILQNDCYHFFKKFMDGVFLIKTGHTGTNVMDIHVLLITNKTNCKS